MLYTWHRLSLVYMAGFLLTSVDINAAEIISVPWDANPDEYSSIGIIGEIKSGDAEKFEQILRESKPDISVHLWSQGGDLIEAMKIGHRIRSMFLHTHAPNPGTCLSIVRSPEDFDWWPVDVPIQSTCECNSSCFAIWIAGVSRSGGHHSYRYSPADPETVLGIHRPRFDPKYFSGLGADEAEDLYEKMLSSFSAYLIDMDVPESLIEEILVIPSNEIRYISETELDSLSGRIPAIEEWMRSKCGGLTDEETDDYLALQNREWGVEQSGSGIVPLSKAEDFYFQHLRERWSASLECEYQVFVEEQTRRLGRVRTKRH